MHSDTARAGGTALVDLSQETERKRDREKEKERKRGAGATKALPLSL